MSRENSYAISYLFIERPKLGMELSLEYERNISKRPSVKRKSSTLTFSEILDIETKGFVYHPALLIYTLRFSPEWEQIRQKDPQGAKEKFRTFLNGYSAEFTFLRDKPYTLTVFGDKTKSTLRSNILSVRSEIETEGYGARLDLKYMTLPTTISYTHEESQRRGLSETDSENDIFSVKMKYNKFLGTTFLDASYSDNTHITFGRLFQERKKVVRIQNSYPFLGNNKVTITSNWKYDETDDTRRRSRRYTIYENLRWFHRENLRTGYSYRYDLNKIFEKTINEHSRTKVQNLGFTLNHRLYENLNTGFNLIWTSNQFQNSRIQNYGPEIRFGYTRRIPWGSFDINTSFGYIITDTNLQGGFITVQDEPVTLIIDPPEPILLENENIVIDSIEVRNRGIPCDMGIDYEVFEFGSFVEMRLIPTSICINDGDTVSVDYRFSSSFPFDYATFTQSYGIFFHLWSSWQIGYQFKRSRQTVLSGIEPDNLLDDVIHAARTSYTWRWSTTSFEFEDSDSRGLETRRWKINESITIRPSPKLFLNFSSSYSKLNLIKTGERRRFLGLKGSIQRIIANWASIRLEGNTTSVSGRGEDFIRSQISSTFEWFYYIWRGEITLTYTRDNDKLFNEKERGYLALFRVNRGLF